MKPAELPDNADQAQQPDHAVDRSSTTQHTPRQREVGGPSGLEPTRYGDWERKGRCIDF
ncbi:MAG: DUF1674 domain-containing protein [Gammaproteobacteria bacterium]